MQPSNRLRLGAGIAMLTAGMAHIDDDLERRAPGRKKCTRYSADSPEVKRMSQKQHGKSKA